MNTVQSAMPKKNFHFVFYIGGVALGMIVLIYIQKELLQQVRQSKNEQFELSANRGLSLLMDDLANAYHCFDLRSEFEIDPQEGFVMLNGLDGRDTLKSLLIDGYSDSDTATAYPNPLLVYNEPIRAQIHLQLSFLGSEDVSTLDIDTSLLKWIDDAYANTLRDANSHERLVDTVQLKELVETHFASIVPMENIGYTIESVDDHQRIYTSNMGAVERASNEEVFQTGLYDGTSYAKDYRLVVYLSGGLGSFNKEMIYLGAALLAVFVLIGVFLLLFIRLLWKQKILAETKNDFVNNMTHEFKTPVTNIKLAIDTLHRRMNGSLQNRDLIQAIDQENERIDIKLNRILDIARMEDSIELNLQEISPNELIDSSLKEMELQLKEKARVQWKHQQVNRNILVDPVLMKSVLLCLIDNALKYSKEECELKISTREEDSTCVISVEDNGPGMSEQTIEHLFDKFYRAPTGRKHDVKGFGLGLYYSKMITHKHGGKIKVWSKLNHGSKFNLEIPIGHGIA
ncbi:MAG: HAMP domain-containing histidine kinase [Flavobacteriales bacterium]|nr:HAMP domain-containing histidine kinase [Flavobacteriales bacterium]